MLEHEQVKSRVFVVDDDSIMRAMIDSWLRNAGYTVECFSDGPSAVAAFQTRTPDAMFLDMEMGPWDGLQVMQRVHRLDPHIPIIFTTARDTVQSAVASMQQGAFDYQVKPLDPDRLLLSLRNALDKRALHQELSDLRAQMSRSNNLGALIGQSRPMQRLFAQIRKVAVSDVTVMVYGESGTGKELVARAIHSESGRRDGPFIDLNCAALPDTLLDSELFGHEKGAFTGAVQSRRGRFERSDGGVLFLDEVAELSPSSQVRLLRVLQERSFERVGGTASIPVDVRIISATHRNLQVMVNQGAFRQDLYYRLVVFPIEIPPLRERIDDLPLLVAHFLRKHGGPKAESLRIDAETLDLLCRHSWPGNIRELENVIQFSLVSCDGSCIYEKDLPRAYRSREDSVSVVVPPPPASTAVPTSDDAERKTLSQRRPLTSAESSTASLHELERKAIIDALRVTGGNVSQAARSLGLGRTTLYRKMANYGLQDPDAAG